MLALLAAVLPWLLALWPEEADEAAAYFVADGPYVALTFDDGPRVDTTPTLLDGLAQRGVHATFFVIGERVAAGQDIVKRMADEGHQVGLHTNSHQMLTRLSAADIAQELAQVRQPLTDLLGDLDFMLRPPYGKVNDTVRAQAGTPIILWSIDPEDWSDHDTARQVALITAQAQDGDIILLHDIYASSVDTALQVVDILMARGFHFVTVEELFALRGVQPEDGAVYSKLPAASS
jgi:peptidoglycan/xylan/chitin deacetylase (PgdA/CDA1 family)